MSEAQEIFGDLQDLQGLRLAYEAWSRQPTFLKWYGREIGGAGHVLRRVERFSRAARRGNQVYRWRVRKRLNRLLDFPVERQFFDLGSLPARTSALALVLEYDANRFSRQAAWAQVNRDWAKFQRRLRKRFGEYRFIRTWEAHPSGDRIRGYPHVNALVVFREAQFEPFEHVARFSGQLEFRVEDRERIHGSSGGVFGRDDLTELWKWGYSDVHAVDSAKKVVAYFVKYILKHQGARRAFEGAPEYGIPGLTQPQAVSNNSVLWVQRRRSFSISKGFAEALFLDQWSEPVKRAPRRDTVLHNLPQNSDGQSPSLTSEQRERVEGGDSRSEAGGKSSFPPIVQGSPVLLDWALPSRMVWLFQGEIPESELGFSSKVWKVERECPALVTPDRWREPARSPRFSVYAPDRETEEVWLEMIGERSAFEGEEHYV